MKKKPDSKRSRPPVAKLLGIRLVKTGRGTAVCVMRTRERHRNPVGTVHGGILCDLADAAMGFAFFSHLPDSRQGVAANFQISFLKPVFAGDHLRAAARTLHHGRSLCFLECEVRNRSGELVAKAASTCKVLPTHSTSRLSFPS